VKVFFRGKKWDHNVYWNLEVLKSGVTWPVPQFSHSPLSSILIDTVVV